MDYCRPVFDFELKEYKVFVNWKQRKEFERAAKQTAQYEVCAIYVLRFTPEHLHERQFFQHFLEIVFHQRPLAQGPLSKVYHRPAPHLPGSSQALFD